MQGNWVGHETSTPSRMVELDALRGIAAIAVLGYHFTTRYQEQIGHVGGALALFRRPLMVVPDPPAGKFRDIATVELCESFDDGFSFDFLVWVALVLSDLGDTQKEVPRWTIEHIAGVFAGG